MRASHHLARCEAKVRETAQRGVAVDILRGQRLFEPVNADRLERPGALRRRRDVPARLEVARHPPALIRVDHDLESRADGVADRLDDGDIVAPVGVMEPDLHRADPRLAKLDHSRDTLLERKQLCIRRVREQPLRPPAEQLPARRLERAADEIPHGDLRRPWARVVEVDRLAQLVYDLSAERIDADEQPLEELTVRQRVAACVALDSVVAADDHDRRLLPRARDWVPGDAERRLEREDVASRLDAGDAHQSPE